MSLQLLWGIGTPPPQYLLRRRITTEGDIRITPDLDVRVAYKAPVAVLRARATMDADGRITMDGNTRVINSGVVGASYLASSNATTDGGEPFRFQYFTNPWQPSAQGGENVFAWAIVTISWSLAATIRVQPIVDGLTDDVVLENGDLVEVIRPVFNLAQQNAALQRVSQVFMVPLVRRITRAGVEVSRFYLRGERIQFLVESTGALGTGELLLEGIELEFEPVRKAIYAQAEATR